MTSPVGAMFGRIAGVYDPLNHILSFGIDKSWRRELARLAPAGFDLLDLAAGTLDVSLALRAANPQAKIIAMDFCQPMLIQGRKKLATPDLASAISLCCGDALRLPLPDNSVDGITIAFGIRNITPRVAAFREMLRILRPGGKACVLEFGSAKERILGGAYNIYLKALLPLIGRMISHDSGAYEYLARTIREFPSAPELASEMEQAGLERASFRKLTGGIVCLHWAFKPIEKAACQT